MQIRLCVCMSVFVCVSLPHSACVCVCVYLCHFYLRTLAISFVDWLPSTTSSQVARSFVPPDRHPCAPTAAHCCCLCCWLCCCCFLSTQPCSTLHTPLSPDDDVDSRLCGLSDCCFVASLWADFPLGCVVPPMHDQTLPCKTPPPPDSALSPPQSTLYATSSAATYYDLCCHCILLRLIFLIHYYFAFHFRCRRRS